MTYLKHGIVLLVVLASSALMVPAASASGARVLADCNATGHLSRSYSAADLRDALVTMPADVKEYTDCYDVIQRALLAKLAAARGGAASGTGSQGSGGSFLPPVVIVLLALLVIAAVSVGAVALRRRGDAAR